MHIRIERGSSTPISRQIMEQIRAHCLSGTLQPGDSLPSVRKLATRLGVNVNTVVRVYERLAAESLVEMRHGEGTFVLPQAAISENRQQLAEQREQLEREFSAVVHQGLLLGLTAAELRKLLTTSIADAKRELKTEAATRQ
ncbi:GntR family transcriptional regulator [Gimesia sp.]|mgnify:FL=1|uniref:GntR family transcriptional regulator n=1 Tax=Gimesia sp. TaxID=2024833 RepID=UPI000C6A0356|nr:GntR family transcriptional regulator [Gimesia sp.]MAX39212.1 GntR family transcriptional regulator [Gimesia sp.]HAH48830.1 GntR family transcriptional regulator [Planctomycetaceae bacterium]HBL45102.1 GntR family transcriptional regulator [Planctomycetaceae bacterium]|tara:strand:+ start:1025 stop:1447 length:423 start_codon:yes stop_codon:yes gene_type:complete